jgi:hypothetical protein
MSGGHYDYLYHRLNELADSIEGDFIDNGKYMGEDWGSSEDFYGRRPAKEYDRLEDATPEQKLIILSEIKSLIKDLRNCSNRAKELEWYMSGDTGASSYLERLKNIEDETYNN